MNCLSTILLTLFAIYTNNVNAENNKLICNPDTQSCNQSSTNFGCSPPEKWYLLKQNKHGRFVNNVCVSSTYQVNEPPEIDKMVPVYFSFINKKILELDARKKSMTMLIGIMLIWEEPRINITITNFDKPIKLPGLIPEDRQIWFPLATSFIKDLKELSPIWSPMIAKDVALYSGEQMNEMLSWNNFSSHTTTVLAYPKWSVKIACDFDFLAYPFDRNECPFLMVADHLELTKLNSFHFNESWLSKEQTEFDGFIVSNEVVLINESLNKWIPKTGFGLNITITRQFAPYLYQYYIPTILIVISSFFSFFIPLTAIPGRVAILVTQFLTLTNIFIHEMSESPSGAKLNLLGLYLLISMLFVFGAMVEFTVVLIAKQIAESQFKYPNSMSKESEMKKGGTERKLGILSGRKRSSRIQNYDSEYKKKKNYGKSNSCDFLTEIPRVMKIDLAAFVLFNLLFVIFNFIYFINSKN